MRKLRLVLDVSYNENGVPEEDLRRLLGNVVMHAMNDGLLTGETEAEVGSHEYRVEVVPVPGERIRVSGQLQEFFAAEIRNEDGGGVRPATLDSALCSWVQAPEDIQSEWTGLPVKRLRKVERELRELIHRYGPDVSLASLTDTK